ncbi:MAG: type II secretion system protein [Phycisphaerae bacterium]|nr:type II secretion system protein [Phycisphaerae bacterium]
MKQAFTLIELLVVIAIISILMALSLPVLKRVREQGAETVCKSNLRQMALILKTYGGDHDGLFPETSTIYHSSASFADEVKAIYPVCCRWHDARINLDSILLCRDHPEYQGSLVPYLGGPWIVRCSKGVRANRETGCFNACEDCVHDPRIPVVPQYTYTMNAYLRSTLQTAGTGTGSIHDAVDARTIRVRTVRKETQITRSPSEVFAFGEQNSWAINTEGRQPIGVVPELAAPYNLSGKYYLEPRPPTGCHGTLRLGSLNIETTYWLQHETLAKKNDRYIGNSFATYHRPRKGDLNTGHSYVSMLDGHVRQVTVADQLRKSRRVPGLPESRLGPGGNLSLAWPLDVPPPGGWENQ